MDQLSKEIKGVGLAQLDQRLVSQAQSKYDELQSSLSGINEFLNGAKPDHAETNEELKASINEADALLSVIKRIRYISV